MYISTTPHYGLFLLKKAQKQFFITGALLLMILHASAQVPVNDEPCNAVALTPAAVCSYSTFTNVDASATTGVSVPTCAAGSVDADVWFTAVVPAGATSIVIDTKNLILTDGYMAVYTGTCSSLTQVGCDDNSSTNPGMPKLTVTAAAGTTVWIRIWGFQGEMGTFGICVTANIPPANDDCTNAQSLTVNPDYLCGTVTAGTTINATQSANTPSPTCGTLNGWNDDVWYTFTATNANHRISLLNITPANAMTTVVYSGTCAGFTQVACNTTAISNLTGLTVGTTYYVRVYTNVTTAATRSSFNICVGTQPPPPANDECAGAISLTVNPTLTCTATTAGTTESATQSATTPNPTCGTVNGWNDDVWYTFTATGPNHRITLSNITPAGTAMNTVVYSGTCAALTQIACTTTGTTDLTGLTAGTVYYVRVYTNVTTATTIAYFNICVATIPPPPANDEPCNAIQLTPGATCTYQTFTNASATATAGVPAPGCANYLGGDVWFKVTVPTGGVLIFDSQEGVITDGGMALYTGTCSNLTLLACDDDSSPNGLMAMITQGGLVPGSTVWVRFWEYGNDNNGTFGICVTLPPPPPANDNCAGAVSLTVNPNYLCGTVTAGTTVGGTATTGVPAPSCGVAGAANDDVWFSFSATNTSHRISLLNVAPAVGMTMVVYSGTCGTLTEIGCNTTSLMQVSGLTIGTTYYVRVFTNTATASTTATFNICVGTPPPPPANDDCAGAISLTVNSNQLCAVTTAGSTAGATQSPSLPTPSCSPANGWDDDVWYSFVAVTNNHTVSLLNVSGTTTNMLTSVYAGTCGSLIQIACITVDPNVINLTNLTPGNTYYVRVQTELTGVDASFSICVGTPGPGAVCTAGNAFCSTSGVTYPSVTNQPSLGGGGIYGCLGSTPNPTWFYMQVSQAGNLVFQVSQTSTGGGGIDVDYAAWGPFTSQADGCNQLAAGGITPISCSYSTAAIETITINNVQVGQFYIVLITNFNGGAGTITFNTTTGNTGSTNCNIVCSTTASNSGPVCPGGTFNLTSTAVTGSTFSWTGPGGFTSTQQNPTNVVAPLTPGSYVYTVTTTNGTTSCSGSTTVIVNSGIVPTFNAVAPICAGATLNPLPTTSNNGITGTWSPALNNTTTTTYTFTPNPGTCATTTTLTITVNQPTVPTFTQVAAICSGGTLSPLPTTSNNGITGTWSPALNNTATTTYTFTPTAGQCATTATMTITVNSGTVVPTFTQVAPICAGGTLSPLPTTSTNGITGTWSPALNNTVTTTYTFTPATGQCATTATMTIVVNNPVTPTFTQVAPICSGGALSALPTTSTNGITGTWSPALNNTATTTYTFTPTAGQCATTATMTITVTPNVTPTFTAVAPICSGGNLNPLPTTSNNGITGTWSPALNNTATTTYTFTPTAGQCATTATLIITVTPNVTPTFTQVAPICSGGTLNPLPTTSNNGINGTWSPALNNTATTTYTFTPNAGVCATIATMTITINQPVIPSFNQVAPVCVGGTITALPTTSLNGITGTWSPAINNTVTTTYTFTPTAGQCAAPTTMVITVNQIVTPTFVQIAGICTGSTLAALPGTSTNGITGTWSPAPNNTVTTTYTFTPAAGQCATTATMTITVNPRPNAPVVSVAPVNYCQNATAAALVATGTNLLWYTTASGGTGSAPPFVPATATAGPFTYYVSQSTAGCESQRASITVNISPALIANAGPDVTIGSGGQTQLNGTGSTQGASYLWTANGPLSLSSATILNPIANPIQTTIYTLTVTDPTALCAAASDNVTVTVVTSCINVRNAFTPNGDGINDSWYVYDQSFCLKAGGVKVNVFNRYGNKVYESKNYTNNWDGTYKGKPVPDGTYYGVVEFTLANGNTQIIRTDITVLR